MRELDVLLARYVDECFAAATQPEQQAFESLLDAQDPIIYAYCMGQTPVPARFQSLIRLMTTVPPDR